MKNPHAVQGAGASNRLASRHEVPTSLTSQIQPPVPDAVSVFAPWAGEQEKLLRRRLRNAWTIASARGARSRSGNARQLYWQVAMVASEWTFARASLADLKDIADGLVRMFVAANVFERVEGPDA